jgi:hypothetical protein
MRATTHPEIDPSFITLCIKMAQSTFSDVMPPDAEAARRASDASDPKPGLLSRLDDWFYRQQLNAREAYLAESSDIFDLECRMRQLEQRPYC